MSDVGNNTPSAAPSRDERCPAGRLSGSTVDVGRLGAGRLETLATELYEAGSRVFSGLARESFFRDMFESGAASTRIRLFRDGERRIVGFAAVFRHDRSWHGRDIAVFRGWAGLPPEYRGRGRTFRFYTVELLKYRLRHPLRPVYAISLLIHPSSYVAFARFYGDVHPRRDRPVPRDMLALMSDFADAIGYPAVDPADPLVRDTGEATREARTFWDETDDPDVTYFRERVPGYRDGNALLVLVPITLGRILRSAPRCVLDYLRRRLGDR